MDDDAETRFAGASLGSFRVTWGVQPPSVFQEVSGLEQDEVLSARRRIGGRTEEPLAGGLSRLTLRRGVVAAEDRLWNWYRAALAEEVVRSVVLIDLIDEQGTPLMTWLMKNAWPTNVVAAVPASDGSVAVETIVLAFDTIEVTSS